MPPLYTPDEYERISYYNGITQDGDHPELVYRSDFLTTPFPKPVGRYANIPVKSLRGVFGTPLNGVWDTVGPEIRDLIKARKINWSSIDPARFFTHGEEKGSLGPVVIWVGVIPGSTSSDTAHEVSQEILALLLKNGVEDAVVEWREAVMQRLAGQPLMRHVGDSNATHYVRRFLTALLGIPLPTEGMEEEDAQGTLTLWFHESKDKDGNPSDKVYGVSNCHVLRKDTTVEYEHRSGTPENHVRVCGLRRFQRGLDEIRKAIDDHDILTDLWAREIFKLEANERQDAENAKEIRANRRKLEDGKEAIADPEALYDEVTKNWSDINFHRNIGYVQYAAAITVDVEGGTPYTSDWAAFLAAEAKVKDKFEGNVVDLAAFRLILLVSTSSNENNLIQDLSILLQNFRRCSILRVVVRLRSSFPRKESSGLRVAPRKRTSLILQNSTAKASAALSSVKTATLTDLTVGRYAGLVSFTLNEVGIESVELGIYNSGIKNAEAFSAKGDSGSLVWHTKNGKARIVGQLHSGNNKGGSTSNHVTYCTPGWYLLDQIKKKFKYADFYRTTWSS